MVKVGKYTSAITLMLVGGFLLFDVMADRTYTGELLRWWPVLVILLGAEYLVLSMIHRNREGKFRFAIGSLLTSLILSFAVIGFTQGSSLGFLNHIQFGPFGTGKAYVQEMTVIPFDESTDEVHLVNPNGKVTMQAGNVDDIQIDWTVYVSDFVGDQADEIANESKIEFQRDGHTLKIVAAGKPYRIFLFQQKPRIDLSITIPEKIAANYELDLTNGKVEVNGLAIKDYFQVGTTNGGITIRDLAGSVQAETTNGGVLIENIVGNVDVETTNGSITVNHIDGNAEVETTNGKIRATDISGNFISDTTNGSIAMVDVARNVEGHTTNGSIEVRSTTMNGDWKLETTNGRIDVYVPRDADFKVDGSARYRKLNTDFSLVESGNKVRGTVGDGTHTITLNTRNGIGIFAQP